METNCRRCARLATSGRFPDSSRTTARSGRTRLWDHIQNLEPQRESSTILPISTTPLIQCALPSSKENLTRRTEKNRHCQKKTISTATTPNRMTTYDGLNRIEQQRQRFAQSPGDQNQQRHDEQRDLNAAPDRHRHGEIKLAFAGHDHGGGVLCSVGEDGQDDQRQELSRDRPILCAGGKKSVN
jgi:hypothetical protein